MKKLWASSFERWLFRFPEFAAETIALLFTIILTAFVTYTQFDRVEKELIATHEHDKSALEQQIRARLAKYEAMLLQTATWATAMSSRINLTSFRNMVRDLNLQSEYVGTLGLGIIRRTPLDNIARLERRMSKEYGSRFSVYPGTFVNGVTYPVIYLEPASPANRSALGFVRISEPKVWQAMELARDTDQVAGTEAANNFTVFAPLYSRPTSQLKNVESRRASLFGFMQLSLDMTQLLESVTRAANIKRDNTQLAVFVGDRKNQELIYSSRVMSRHPDQIVSENIFQMGLRTWRVVFWKARTSYFSAAYRSVWLTLAIGSLISSLISALVWSLKQRLASQRRLVLVQLDQKLRLENAVAEKTQALSQANNELTHANAELEAFTYSVSHDLRAPLRGIDGFCHVLLDDYRQSLDDEGQKYLDFIRQGVQRMGTLIDDLLNLSRITRAPFEPTEVDLTKLGEEIANYVQRENPKVKLIFEVAPGMRAYADPGLLRVLLENLINNAVKFSQKSQEIRVEVGALSDPKQGTIYFVKDQGIGFDIRYAAKIFDPFQRLHTEAEFPGTGIGLATCRRVVQRHGGKIWAEAEPGKGAVFYFTLQESGFDLANNPEAAQPNS